MDDSLLDSNIDDKDALLNQMILNAAAEDPNLLSSLQKQAIPTTVVVPTPGFCLKTKNGKNEKVFINLCTAEHVPSPQDLSESELLKLLESDDPTGFRIPMSIGEPHAEIDKSGGGCTAYDVVVSPKFMEKMKDSELFRTFFLTVMMEGLEDKYDMQLSREWIMLKNRRCVGTIQEQNMRTQSKPFIMEMGQDTESQVNTSSQNKLIQEVHNSKEDLKSRGKEPEYRIIQEPAEGHPDFLVAEINLPQVKVSSSISLDIGEDRILLQTRSNIYYLDIYIHIPYFVQQSDCGAQFNRKTRILTITMPVQSSS